MITYKSNRRIKMSLQQMRRKHTNRHTGLQGGRRVWRVLRSVVIFEPLRSVNLMLYMDIDTTQWRTSNQTEMCRITLFSYWHNHPDIVLEWRNTLLSQAKAACPLQLSQSIHLFVIKFFLSAHFHHGCPPLQEIPCATFNLHFLPLTGSSFIGG